MHCFHVAKNNTCGIYDFILILMVSYWHQLRQAEHTPSQERIAVIFESFEKKEYFEMIVNCKLWSSCLSRKVLKASFSHARYHHDYSNPLHIRKKHVFPTCLLT